MVPPGVAGRSGVPGDLRLGVLLSVAARDERAEPVERLLLGTGALDPGNGAGREEQVVPPHRRAHAPRELRGSHVLIGGGDEDVAGNRQRVVRLLRPGRGPERVRQTAEGAEVPSPAATAPGPRPGRRAARCPSAPSPARSPGPERQEVSCWCPMTESSSSLLWLSVPGRVVSTTRVWARFSVYRSWASTSIRPSSGCRMVLQSS